MSSPQVINNIENQKLSISQLIFQIEKEYKETNIQSIDRQKEIEDRERDIERIKQKLTMIRDENEQLQQTVNESFLRNSYLQQQIEESELESQQNMQIIQQMNRKINYLQDIKRNLENMNNIHSNSIENTSIMEQTNDEYKKQLEQNNIKIQKIDTEIQFSKERLEALLKKYQQLKMNEKSIKELQTCLDREKNKYNKQVQNLSLQNSTLQGQVKEMHTSFVQVKQEVKANKEPRQQHTLAQIAQILTPEDFDRKPKYHQELSETSCKTFHLFQESSFMNKIKVTEFNSNNYPDNESDRMSMLSVKHVPSAPAYSQISNSQQGAAPPGLLQQRSRNQNNVIKQTNGAKESQGLLKNTQQSKQQYQSSNQQQQYTQNTNQYNLNNQKQTLNQLPQKQQQQTFSSQVQYQPPKQQQIKQQIFQSQYIQQQQQQQQQQQYPQQQLKPSPTKQYTNSAQNKNIERNRAVSDSQQNYIYESPKKPQPLTIYESQKIYEKPENMEETPKKPCKSQLSVVTEIDSHKTKITASLKSSPQSFSKSKIQEESSQKNTPDQCQRKKSNSLHQNLMIGAGVLVTAGLLYYALAPKK